MQKIISYLKSPKKCIVYLMNKNFFSFLPDKIYLKIKYKLIMGKKLNLKNPVTFNEKLQWLKLYDRNSDYTIMVDKSLAKDYVGNIIGSDKIINTLGVYDKFDDIDFNTLPEKFVIKPTHTSGDVFICKDKSKIDMKQLKKKTKKWLKRNYYKVHREWPYKDIKRKLIVEEFMADSKQEDLVDYKVMCFNGEPKIIFTCTDRFESNLKVTFFDKKWEQLPCSRHYPASEKKIDKPYNFDLMLELSKKLSKDITFVRVDWYEINNKLYFGELTFYPGSGYEEFNPEIWDERIGQLITLREKGGK